MKFQVLWPKLKVGSSIAVMFTVRTNRFGGNHQKRSLKDLLFKGLLKIRMNLLEGGSKNFFAYLPRIGR